MIPGITASANSRLRHVLILNSPTVSVVEGEVTVDPLIVIGAFGSVTYSIAGGADAALFDAQFAVLSFLLPPDYEYPTDANEDNVYDVVVKAEDSRGFDLIRYAVTVTNIVDETAPTITSDDQVYFEEAVPLAHLLTADEAVTWSIVAGGDGALFELFGGSTLRFVADAVKTYATPDDSDADGTYRVSVRATDGIGNQTDQSIYLTLTDATGWYTMSRMGTPTLDGGSFGVTDQRNLRQYIPAPAVGWPANSVMARVTFISGTANPMVLEAASIGTGASSGDSYDYTGDQAALTFDGGSPGVTIPMNTTKVSDAVDFTFPGLNRALIVAMFHDDVTSDMQGIIRTDAKLYKKFPGDTDDSMTTNATGYTVAFNNRIFGIEKVEVNQGLSVAPSLYVDSDAFFTQTIANTNQILTTTLYVDAEAFFTQVVLDTTQNLTAAIYTDTDTFFTQVVTSWLTTWSQAHNITSLSWNGFTLRMVIPASLITISGSKVRISIQGGNTEGAQIDALYIGHAAAAGDAYDFDGTQVQCLSGGLTTFTVGVNATLLLDEVTYALDETKNFIVAAHFNNAAADNIGGRAIAGYTSYSKAANEAGTTDVTGYTASGSTLRLVNKIEVFA